MRNVLRRIVPAAVIITGLAIATLPAIPVLAASATTADIAMNAKPVSPAHVALPGLKVVPAQQAASFHICLINSSPYMCQKANGTGNQVTISRYSTDWANFSIVRMTTCCSGLAVYQFEDGNGNCLRAGTNNVVKIENGGCASNDNADWWVGAGSGRLQSYLYGDLMLTHGEVSGYKLWHAARISGDWTDWTY
jgi:hypothetical protein